MEILKGLLEIAVTIGAIMLIMAVMAGLFMIVFGIAAGIDDRINS